MHLLYSRFFTRALSQIGYLDLDEPFTGLMTQGMVCHQTFQDEDGKWLFPTEVIKEQGNWIKATNGRSVNAGRIEKMSKSKRNVVDPETIVENYGADTARLFMLSDSPPERDMEWTEAGVEAHRALKRISISRRFRIALSKRQFHDSEGSALALLKIVHKSIIAYLPI